MFKHALHRSSQPIAVTIFQQQMLRDMSGKREIPGEMIEAPVI
jgi:hypothetical protein